jgi:acetyl esterase/lipase
MKIALIQILLFPIFLGANFLAKAQQNVSWKALDEKALHIDSIIYKKTAATDLSLFYFLPEQIKAKEKYPAIIFIHGGAWTGGGANVFYSYAAYFAKRNITAISIDYRLIKQPADDIVNCIADCKSAIRFIKKNASIFHADTSKIIICGESAGGHLAACMELLEGFNDNGDDLKISSKPAALVLLNPVVNLVANNFIKYVDAAVLKSTDKLPDSAMLIQKYASRAISISPLYQVKKTMPPTLLINGLIDKITPAIYAQAFADSVNNKNNNCQLILLPNTGHAFAVPHYKSGEADIVSTVTVIDNFLVKQKFLKGKAIIVNGNDEHWLIKK